MQTLSEIRRLLKRAGLRPQKRFGQNFLIDRNLMAQMVELAGLTGAETVLEVGPATGSLTEELLSRSARVVAVELDRGLFGLLRDRFAGQEKLLLLQADVLASKHRLNPDVLSAVGDGAVHMVANLPYSVATPVVGECLLASWRWGRRGYDPQAGACRFERMTSTVQQEVADRMAAAAGGGDYGPVSVLVSLLGRVQLGSAVPASAFWPRPKVASRVLRIDFDPAAAEHLADAAVLVEVLRLTFGQRRKQIGSAIRRKDAPFGAAAFRSALDAAGIDPTLRAEAVPPERFLALANALAER